MEALIWSKIINPMHIHTPPHLFLRSALIALLLLLANRVSSQTTLLWSESAGTSSSQQKSFVAVDLIGNIYMASSVNGTYGLDWKVTSWRPDSVLRWSFTHNGTGNLDDVPAAIVVDSAFNVYISGTSRSSGSNDIKMIKLDSAGNVKWNTTYNRTGSAQDVGTGMVVVGNRIFLSGYSQQTTSNYDYTVLKYDTTGLLLWSRHVNGSGSGDDYTSSIAAKSNGDVYVTGNAVITGGTRDIMTLRYTTDGTLQWTKYYGLTTGKNDFGNALGIDAAGNLIVVGQSFVNNNNSDLVSVKYNGTTGAQTWAAKYSGTYGGHDIGNALVIDPDNYFYVTGSTERASNNTDYVTIKYRGNGAVTWVQTYNGPGNAADDSRAIIHDGDDVVITGKSGGSGTGADVTTMSYNKGTGVLNWTMRINGSTNGNDDAWSLARDEMGNVIAGATEPVTSANLNTCIKFHQKPKNDLAISKNLEVISAGYSELKTDTIFKRIIWYNILRGYDDSIYLMYADQLRTLGDAGGINATTRISTKMSAKYGWASSYNWAVIKSKQMWRANQKVYPFLGVPELFKFTKSDFIANVPNTAFAHLEFDYPVGCTTCGDYALDTTDLVGKSAWVFFVDVPPFIYYPRPQVRPFVNCWVGRSLQQPLICEVCPANSQASYPVTTFGGTGHHEVGILASIYDLNGYCADNISDANSLDSMPFAEMNIINYARLQALSNGVYWTSSTSGTGYSTVRRSYQPHIGDIWNVHMLSGITLTNEITLCSYEPAKFHETGESTPRYSMDQGGIYRVWRPDIATLTSMYFYASPWHGMTYLGGPDMNLYYAAQDNDSACASGNFSFSPNCEIWNSLMGSHSTNQLIGDSSAFDLFATANMSLIAGYWMDNAITIGLEGVLGNNGPEMNVVDFYADSSNAVCDPLSYTDLDTVIAELFCFPGNVYEIDKAFYGSMTTQSGSDLLIHVEANYKNGESINQCQYYTINANFTSVSAVAAIIRGDIKDYNSSIVNYHVTIYSTLP